MSSIRVSVSGQRGRTFEDHPDHVALTMPTKGDDEVYVSVASAGVIEAVLPSAARIEKRKSGDSEYLILVIPKNGSLSFGGIKDDTDGVSSWPHVEVDLRAKNPKVKFTRDHLTPVEGSEPFEVKSLFSPTPED